MLFAKTLVRKGVASSSPSGPTNDDSEDGSDADDDSEDESDDDDDSEDESEDDDDSEDGSEDGDDSEVSTKAQVMTLMTTDVDRVSDFAEHIFAVFGGHPITV